MEKEKRQEKDKNTRRALTTSLLLIFISLILLVGTTFAWFTDSATSGKNKIVAGNLDIELQYADVASVIAAGGTIAEDAWQAVGEDDNLFKSSDDTLWEPGHTEMAFLRIKNNGTLTLNYDFNIKTFGTVDGGAEKTYVNSLNNDFKISNYLVMNVVEGTELKARNEYWIQDPDEETAALGKLTSSNEGITLAPGETKDITLVVYMPKTIGNDANQLSSDRETKGAPELYFGLDLTATQASQEADSFGNDYDANVE